MGYILAAFGWSYALFEIPSGWLGDCTGARSALTRIVTFWSVFTAATAWVWNFASLFIIRFLFGAGEAGCFPNLTKALKAWLPQREQARAQGIMWMSARWGGAFAPYFVFLMFRYVSWQRAFVLVGVIGFFWVAILFRWYRDDPRTWIEPGGKGALAGSHSHPGACRQRAPGAAPHFEGCPAAQYPVFLPGLRLGSFMLADCPPTSFAPAMFPYKPPAHCRVFRFSWER